MEGSIYTENTEEIQEERKAPIWKIAIITGLVGALPAIVLYTLTQPKDMSAAAEQRSNFLMMVLPYLIQLAAITWGIIWLKRKWPQSEFTFGSGFKGGLRTGLFYALATGISAYVGMVIMRQDPEKMERMRAMAIEAAEKKTPNMTDEQMQMTLKIMDFFTMPIVTFLSTAFYLVIIALLLSLVVSIFTQTRPTS